MISCTFWRSRIFFLNSPKLSCGFNVNFLFPSNWAMMFYNNISLFHHSLLCMEPNLPYTCPVIYLFLAVVLVKQDQALLCAFAVQIVHICTLLFDCKANLPRLQSGLQYTANEQIRKWIMYTCTCSTVFQSCF